MPRAAANWPESASYERGSSYLAPGVVLIIEEDAEERGHLLLIFACSRIARWSTPSIELGLHVLFGARGPGHALALGLRAVRKPPVSRASGQVEDTMLGAPLDCTLGEMLPGAKTLKPAWFHHPLFGASGWVA